MAGQTDATSRQPHMAFQDHLQRRHTIAALVYFLYGLFYLFGAQYFTSMQTTTRGMSNPGLFFALGGVITIAFPLLIYRRFALALSLYRTSSAQRATLFINFTLILALLVSGRVIALLRSGRATATPLHTLALLIAILNAACLLWAALKQPWWITRLAETSAPARPTEH